jgi:general secretion pathway protein G
MTELRDTRRKVSRRAAHGGFTLLELMIVIIIIIVLATLGAGRYDLAIIRAHQAAQIQDLDQMNQAIQNYTRDKEAAPTSLDDLVQAQYLGRIPNDPVTGANDWVPDNCDTLLSVDQTATGICSVHAASPPDASQ